MPGRRSAIAPRGAVSGSSINHARARSSLPPRVACAPCASNFYHANSAQRLTDQTLERWGASHVGGWSGRRSHVGPLARSLMGRDRAVRAVGRERGCIRTLHVVAIDDERSAMDGHVAATTLDPEVRWIVAAAVGAIRNPNEANLDRFAKRSHGAADRFLDEDALACSTMSTPCGFQRLRPTWDRSAIQRSLFAR